MRPLERIGRFMLGIIVAVMLLNLLLSSQLAGSDESVARHLHSSKSRFKRRASAKEANLQSVHGSTNSSAESVQSFAACLLIKDDNRLLWEFLAYHWLVLPLRHLVVAVDPNSHTSPNHIFDQYRRLGMEIEELQEQEFFKQKPIHLTNDKSMLGFRQHSFLNSCLRRLRMRNRTWTMILDTDEFLVFNQLEPPGEEGTPRQCQRMPSEAEAQNCTREYYQTMLSHPRASLPKVGEITVAEYMSSRASSLNNSCYVLPRSTFVSKETEDYGTIRTESENLSERDFTTLRYLYHGPMQNKLPGKSIVNAQLIPDDLSVGNPHRVMDDCEPKTGFTNHFTSLLRVHHYIGSADLFLSRSDSRRTRDVWNRRNSVEIKGKSNALVGWVSTFQQRVGASEAKRLTTELLKWAFEIDRDAYRQQWSGNRIICLDIPKSINKDEEQSRLLGILSSNMKKTAAPTAWIPFSYPAVRWNSTLLSSFPTLQVQYLTDLDVIILLQGTRCQPSTSHVFVWILKVYRPKVIEADYKRGCRFLSGSVEVRNWIHNLTGKWTQILEPVDKMNMSTLEML